MAENKQQQQLKEITERLEKGVKGIFTSEKYMEYLRVMSQFHNYSFSNTLLIAMQKPDATLVAGYDAWQKKFERNVMKGEKAIKIFAPAPRKVEVEQDMLDPETQKPILDENGEVKKETVTVKQPFFKITSVFDVSQTEGKPLPELDTVKDLTASVEEYNIFFEALKRTSKVPIDFQPIEGGSHGFYHQKEKRIAIAEGMSEAQNIKTGIHEIAHSRLHDVDTTDAEKGIMVDRRTREVQAESVAYTVCQYYGIDTSEYSFGHIAGWSEGKEMKELRSSMEVIRREADSMIKEIDRNLEIIRKERQQEMEESERATSVPVAEAAELKYTPFYQGYLEVKAAYPDSIVLYQVGDFFEAFNDDAKTIAEAFDLQLTSRPISDTERAALVGLPGHRMETYIDMIRDRGHDVAIASLEAGERKVVELRSMNKEDHVESYAIGRINYLCTDGNVRESVEYTSEYQFAADIRQESFYGTSMTVDVYADKDGNTIDHAFLSTIDPPLKGVAIIPSPYIEDQVKNVPLTSENTEPSEAMNGHSRVEIEEMVLAHAQAEIDSMELSESVKLLGARVYGSRTRESLITENSDIDVVLSYTAPNGELYEDNFFNVLNENGLQIDGRSIDINPISIEETGTLDEYMVRAEAYLDRKELHKQVYGYLEMTSYDVNNLMEAVKYAFPEVKGDTLKNVLYGAAVQKLREQAEEFDEIEVLDYKGLFSNGRVDNTKLPDNLYAYDIRGKDDDPGQFATLEMMVVANHAGTVILPDRLTQLVDQKRLPIGDDYNFTGDSMTLEQFYETLAPGKGETVYAKDAKSIAEKAIAFCGDEVKLFDYLGEDGETILTDLVDKLNKSYVAYMADKELITEAEKTEKQLIVPLSNLTFAEAQAKGEVDTWRVSRKETEACAEQFDKEFGMAYHERRMPEFLADMADKYGMERVKIVLASTIQLADHDGRYYPSTKADAAKVHIPGTNTEDYSKDIRRFYTTNCHPVMINSAFRELQKMERESNKAKESAAVDHDSKPPRTSVLSKLQEKQKQVKVSPTRSEDKKRGIEL